ncbi:sodium/potassium-transporting ATPase subunit beta-1-interacting protein 3 [Dunckerocampus dactyliophorus]|uniref:sodium/potassium-transporting ATPase subunit beta-1-interacting protein 3 n=1 Tax=Dunckerocampus dactyliophorus TaxID=161453 RepID=UPI002406E77B|nr:sodium/potassium-transporting ATPase subunit beta-1-interacting protein 3 [Dunckerocampus dactyliophorus]XP_054638632.1 sodium/potassium-transporting ATPase subunit beta-1-interacting protein 3 [Dunckerocampus dactyliophorus]
MGCCSARCMLVLLCCLQLITTLERQVFDFLGFQWAPIMINFIHIIVVILGLFGAIQYRPRYVILYLLWMLLWLSWNVFVCCLYLDLGGLSKESDILSLRLSPHRSWWKENGPNCQSELLPSTDWQNPGNPQLTTVLSCWLEYQYIEVLHGITQLFISLPAFVYACYVVSLFSNEVDTFDTINEYHSPSKPPHFFH